MAGSILGQDQVKKLNALFPALVAHIRALLAADHSAFGLMKVHVMVESFDSDAMAALFREVSFISPFEKKALVRAAIYQLLASEPGLFSQSWFEGQPIVPTADKGSGPVELKSFTPAAFKLNVATTNANETAKTDSKPEPKVTSTLVPHVSNVVERVAEGRKEQSEAQAKRDVAVAKLREAAAPVAVEEPAHLEALIEITQANAAPTPECPLSSGVVPEGVSCTPEQKA